MRRRVPVAFIFKQLNYIHECSHLYNETVKFYHAFFEFPKKREPISSSHFFCAMIVTLTWHIHLKHVMSLIASTETSSPSLEQGSLRPTVILIERSLSQKMYSYFSYEFLGYKGAYV